MIHGGVKGGYVLVAWKIGHVLPKVTCGAVEEVEVGACAEEEGRRIMWL